MKDEVAIPSAARMKVPIVTNSTPSSKGEAGARRTAVIARLCKLPPFHPAAVRLLTLSADNDATVSDFERAFGSDPALASDLLAMANSPLYGLRARIDNLRHAVVLLGLESVRSLALTAALGAYVRNGKGLKAVRGIWAHSLATALIAEAIGKAQGEPGTSYYAAGLVHDIGRLGLLNLEGDRYAGLLDRDFYEMDESLLLETLVFGCAHDDAGGFLARTWGFPESICDCVRFHHHAAVDSHSALRAVRIACRYAGALGFGELKCADQPPASVDVLPASLRSLPQLQPARVQKRISQAEEEFTGVLVRPPGLLKPIASDLLVK